MFYPPNKIFHQSNSLRKWTKCLCDPLNGNDSIVNHLHKLSCANHNKLSTLHLENVDQPIFLTTYVQIIHYESRVSKCYIKQSMWAQMPFSHEHYKIIIIKHFYQNKHHWCLCKVCIGVATIDWSQHPHMSSQLNKTWSLPSLTFFCTF